MDSAGVRILEGIGYVSLVFVLSGFILRRESSEVPYLIEASALIFGIVLVRLMAIAAQGRSAAARKTAAEPGPESETQGGEA